MGEPESLGNSIGGLNRSLWATDGRVNRSARATEVADESAFMGNGFRG